MNNIKNNKSFFPSVNLKTVKKSFSNKRMSDDYGDKKIFNYNNSETQLKDLINGYYHGFFQYKKSINMVYMNMSSQEYENKKEKQKSLKNNVEKNKKAMQESFKIKIKSKSFSTKKFNLQKSFQLLNQQKAEVGIDETRFNKLKVNGKMLNNKLRTQMYSNQKYEKLNFQNYTKIKQMKKFLKQKTISRMKQIKIQIKKKKDKSFRVGPWQSDPDYDQNI